MEIGPEIDLTSKVSPKCIFVNADNVGFKLACNVLVWAYFEKLPVSGKRNFYEKWPIVLGRIFPVSNFLHSVIMA